MNNKSLFSKFLAESRARITPAKARVAFAPVTRDMGNKRAKQARRACRSKMRDED